MEQSNTTHKPLEADTLKQGGNPAFVKGMKPLAGAGRPKGAVNNVSKEIREIVGEFLATKALPHLIERFEFLNDKNKIELSMQLMKYATPQLSATKIEADINSNAPMVVEIVYKTKDNPNTNIDEAEIID